MESCKEPTTIKSQDYMTGFNNTVKQSAGKLAANAKEDAHEQSK